MSRPRHRLALWLHEQSLPPHERDAVIGDLLEEIERFEDAGRSARWWLWRQTLGSLAPNLRRRIFAPQPVVTDDPETGARSMNGFMTDLRFAFRLMRRQPLMTLVGFLSLSAALALNVLLFTLANAVLFRPFPLRDPASLVVVLLQRPANLNHNLSYPDYAALRDGARTVETLTAYTSAEATLNGQDAALAIDGELVAGNFFGGMGVPLIAGRGLMEDDDRLSATPAVVIAEGLWRDRLAGAPPQNLVVTLNGQPFAVVGVASRAFGGMQLGRAASFWIPLAHRRTLSGGEDLLSRVNASWLTVVGRLRPDVAVDAARQELDAILTRQFQARGRTVEPVVLQPGARGDSMLPVGLASPLMLLMAAGALVLLVSCLNVANLQLARNEARRVELAVRAALGARRGQLVRLMLIDGLALSLAAGAAGLLVSALTKDHAASLIAFFGRPVTLSVPIDARVLAAALALSLASAVIVAILSTWHLLGRQPADGLGDVRAVNPARRPIQRAMIVAQFALSMALLSGAGLLVRTLDQLRRTDLGFDSGRVALLEVSPGLAQLRAQAAVNYFDEARRAIEAMPGVEMAGVSHVMPLDFGGSRSSLSIEGYQPSSGEDMELNFVRVTPGYFETLGIPVLQGRAFDATDREGQPQRIIVNETMARRFWPDGRAVGRFVRTDGQGPYDVEVIGVVRDVHYRMVREESRASFYVPLAQWPSGNGVLHVRMSGDPAPRVEELRRAVSAVNRAVPVMRAGTLRQQVERNIADERMAGTIGVTIASVALLLAAAGLYASMAFFVGRRTREIGVRVALGAQASDVRTLVLREGLVLVGFGIAGGLVLAGWVGHALRQQLYGVERFDALSLAAASIVLVGAAVVASWLPARRAARVDPVVALRES